MQFFTVNFAKTKLYVTIQNQTLLGVSHVGSRYLLAIMSKDYKGLQLMRDYGRPHHNIAGVQQTALLPSGERPEKG